MLDRVHQSMLLFASGSGLALRQFLVDDGAGLFDLRVNSAMGGLDSPVVENVLEEKGPSIWTAGGRK